MSSFLYVSKQAKTLHHPIPSPLSADDVLCILMDHSALASILWPPAQRQDPVRKSGVLEEKQLGPGTTEFRIGPTPGGSSDRHPEARYKARIRTDKDGRGVIVEEDMPLGLTMTLVYSVVSARDVSSDSTASPSGILLEVQRSVSAPRPLSFLVTAKDGEISKTENLLWLLDEMGRNGKDLDRAVDRLEAREAATAGGIEKDKED